MSGEVAIRLLQESDAPLLLDLYQRNDEFLQPWEPLHGDGWLTMTGQQGALNGILRMQRSGTHRAFLVTEDGEPAGRVTLSEIARGAFQGCYVGYFVDQRRNGRGVGTTALRLALQHAFTVERLHRVQASIMPRNIASIRVAEKAGMRREGLAERYLRIAGRWEDHLLYAITAEEWSPPATPR